MGKGDIKMKLKKISDCNLMIMSCGSYFLAIVCMTILGYFYDNIPFKDELYIIPICLLLFGAIFSWMLNKRGIVEENIKLYGEDIKN